MGTFGKFQIEPESEIKTTLKFAGGSIMVKGAITAADVGSVNRIIGRVNAKDHVDYLNNWLIPTYDLFVMNKNKTFSAGH